jgi:hypothetical protein
MRLYTFGNYYLSSIQQGIQSAHVVSELFTKYPFENAIVWDEPQGKPLYDWAKTHKTIICLSGGNCDDLHDLYEELAGIGPTLGLPYAKFREDDASLNGAITCCGIVVPAMIYDVAQAVRGLDVVSASIIAEQAGVTLMVELELAQLLNRYGLAR